MKFYFAFLCAVSGLGLTVSVLPVSAEPAICVLEVGGQSYIDGPCSFERLSGNDGSFKIMDTAGDYFAYVYVEGGGATAHWNEFAGVNRAHTPLGELQRNGACWTSDSARICATAVEQSDGVSPIGLWDCEIMTFALDDQTYKNSSAPAAAIQSIERIADDAFGVTLEDGYRFALFEVTADRLVWHSPASGDTFECSRE